MKTHFSLFILLLLCNIGQMGFMGAEKMKVLIQKELQK